MKSLGKHPVRIAGGVVGALVMGALGCIAVWLAVLVIAEYVWNTLDAMRIFIPDGVGLLISFLAPVLALIGGVYFIYRDLRKWMEPTDAAPPAPDTRNDKRTEREIW